MCSQWISTFHSQGILERCYPKVLWNLRGSAWELPFKANASYWWKWWRMISRCWNACFGNCYRKPKRVARTTGNDVRHWSKRGWAHTKQYVQNSDRRSRGCIWVKAAVIRAEELRGVKSMWASMLEYTQSHLISAMFSTSFAVLLSSP